MDKIVNIRDRIESQRQKKQIEQNRQKIDAIQKVIQCSLCHFRCAMCGLHIKATDFPPHSSPGYAFCEQCRGEYEAFLAISKGEHSDVFWHNKEWVNMWSAWIKYRQAMTSFINSPEFKLLCE